MKRRGEKLRMKKGESEKREGEDYGSSGLTGGDGIELRRGGGRGG